MIQNNLSETLSETILGKFRRKFSGKFQNNFKTVLGKVSGKYLSIIGTERRFIVLIEESYGTNYQIILIY